MGSFVYFYKIVFENIFAISPSSLFDTGSLYGQIYVTNSTIKIPGQMVNYYYMKTNEFYDSVYIKFENCNFYYLPQNKNQIKALKFSLFFFAGYNNSIAFHKIRFFLPVLSQPEYTNWILALESETSIELFDVLLSDEYQKYYEESFLRLDSLDTSDSNLYLIKNPGKISIVNMLISFGSYENLILDKYFIVVSDGFDVYLINSTFTLLRHSLTYFLSFSQEKTKFETKFFVFSCKFLVGKIESNGNFYKEIEQNSKESSNRRSLIKFFLPKLK